MPTKFQVNWVNCSKVIMQKIAFLIQGLWPCPRFKVTQMTFKWISQVYTIHVPNIKILGESTHGWEVKQKDAGTLVAVLEPPPPGLPGWHYFTGSFNSLSCIRAITKIKNKIYSSLCFNILLYLMPYNTENLCKLMKADRPECRSIFNWSVNT